jgi:hypothetical protein
MTVTGAPPGLAMGVLPWSSRKPKSAWLADEPDGAHGISDKRVPWKGAQRPVDPRLSLASSGSRCEQVSGFAEEEVAVAFGCRELVGPRIGVGDGDAP